MLMQHSMRALAALALFLPITSIQSQAAQTDYFATSVPNVMDWEREGRAEGEPPNNNCDMTPAAVDYAFNDGGNTWLRAENFDPIGFTSGISVTSVEVAVQARYDMNLSGTLRIRYQWNRDLPGGGTMTMFDTVDRTLSNSVGDGTCKWRQVDITTKETSWSQDELNSLEIWGRRVSTNAANRLRIKGFRIRISTAVGPAFTTFCNGDGGNSPGCTPCLCGNNAPAGTVGGCSNSVGQSARLLVSGAPSISSDTVSFDVMNATPGSFGFLQSAVNLLPTSSSSCPPGSGNADFDGLRCIGGGLIRYGPRSSDTNGSIGVTNNGWGLPDGPSGGVLARAGMTLVGQTQNFQCFYRDATPGPCGTGVNTTQAIRIIAQP